jgi:protein phosphatase 1 regulatory subunit 37
LEVTCCFHEACESLFGLYCIGAQKADGQARSLKYIDLSDTVWDRKGVEYLVQALNWTVVTPSSASMSASAFGAAPEPEAKEETDRPESERKEEEVEERKASYGSFGRYAPYLKEAEGSDAPSAVQTLRMDGCNLRAFVLEALGQSCICKALNN